MLNHIHTSTPFKLRVHLNCTVQSIVRCVNCHALRRQSRRIIRAAKSPSVPNFHISFTVRVHEIGSLAESLDLRQYKRTNSLNTLSTTTHNVLLPSCGHRCRHRRPNTDRRRLHRNAGVGSRLAVRQCHCSIGARAECATCRAFPVQHSSAEKTVQ